MTVTLDTDDIKRLLKDALSELLLEHREEFQDLMVEALEDLAMIKAIHEGEDTPIVDQKAIYRLLDSGQ